MRTAVLYISLFIAVAVSLFGYHSFHSRLTERAGFVALELAENSDLSDALLEKENAAFDLGRFHDIQKLEKSLNELFPFGTALAEIDAMLVTRMGAFRSDNLIENWKNGLLIKGDSTANNYVYYYKPAQQAGRNGWEESSSGWVIKVTHGNIPRAEDDKVDRMFGGGGTTCCRVPNIRAGPFPTRRKQWRRAMPG